MEANQTEEKSVLPTLRQHHIVEVYNPLNIAFSWPIARATAGMVPRDQFIDRAQMRNTEKPDQPAHVQQTITIPPKGTLKMPGDAAQVYVNHLIKALLQSGEKTKQNTTDPNLRLAAEKEIIKNIAQLQTQMSTLTPEQQFEQQLANLNTTDVTGEATPHEPELAFPGLGEPESPVPSPGSPAAKPEPAKAAARK